MLGKQSLFRIFIILEIRVLTLSDVILGQIQKSGDFKVDAVYPVVRKRLRGHLHCDGIDPRIRHEAKIMVKLEALRRRVHRIITPFEPIYAHGIPAPLSIAAVIREVVVLPFVPVMPIIRSFFAGFP